MKNIVIFSFLVCFSSISFSQRQADNWVWGICNGNGLCAPPFGSGILKFDENGVESITSKYFDYRFTKGSSSISDSVGNLLLAFNGKYLFDSTGAIIDSFYLGGFTEMPIGYKSALFLNVPGKIDRYCLLNSYSDPYVNHPFIKGLDTSFYYTEFRSTELEIETIIRKQSIQIDSSAAGTLAAVRHANGRDWWIMKSSVYQDKFYQALLDITGLQFNPIYTPIPHILQQGGGWNLFSSDGSKFVNLIVGLIRKAIVYDFNRCTGQLTNPIEFDLSDLISSDDVNACCLSPDGTKLYFRRTISTGIFGTQLCQFDFETQTFTPITTGNSAPCRTPNNLHIVTSGVDTTTIPYITSLSIVYAPNQLGTDCQFTEGVFDLINYGFIETEPNFANFRLGALVGSGCDTLSTSVSASISAPNLRLKIFPNPTSTDLTIEQDISNICALEITNMLGQKLWQGITNKQKTILTTEIGQLENGIYWFEIQDLKTGKRAGKRFVKQ